MSDIFSSSAFCINIPLTPKVIPFLICNRTYIFKCIFFSFFCVPLKISQSITITFWHVCYFDFELIILCSGSQFWLEEENTNLKSLVWPWKNGWHQSRLAQTLYHKTAKKVISKWKVKLIMTFFFITLLISSINTPKNFISTKCVT